MILILWRLRASVRVYVTKTQTVCKKNRVGVIGNWWSLFFIFISIPFGLVSVLFTDMEVVLYCRHSRSHCRSENINAVGSNHLESCLTSHLHDCFYSFNCRKSLILVLFFWKRLFLVIFTTICRLWAPFLSQHRHQCHLIIDEHNLPSVIYTPLLRCTRQVD